MLLQDEGLFFGWTWVGYYTEWRLACGIILVNGLLGSGEVDGEIVHLVAAGYVFDCRRVEVGELDRGAKHA